MKWKINDLDIIKIKIFCSVKHSQENIKTIQIVGQNMCKSHLLQDLHSKYADNS